MRGRRGSKVAGSGSPILGRKPRSVREGREKNTERVGRLGYGQSLLTHSEFPPLGGGSWGSWGAREGKGMDWPCVGSGVRQENRQGSQESLW